MLQIKNISKNNNGENIFSGISTSIWPCQILGISWASGSWKTTLLRCIAWLEEIETWSIGIHDPQLQWPTLHKEWHQNISIWFVSQHLSLWPHMTLWEQISHPLRCILKMTPEEAHKKAKKWMTNWGIWMLFETFPWKASQGQKQRVAIIRSSIMKPKILLLDEVTSSLDQENSMKIMNDIQELITKNHMYCLFASHDTEILRQFSKKIYTLKKG